MRDVGLKDNERMVRTEALFLLGKRGGVRSIQLVKPFMSSADWKERATALDAVVRVVKTGLWDDGIPLLLDALADPEPSIRYSAAAHLNLLTGQNRPTVPTLWPEKAKNVEREWRGWWEANKGKYPPGGKAPAPPLHVGAR